MGIIKVAMTMFPANSVKLAVAMQIMSTIAAGGSPDILYRDTPMASESPDFYKLYSTQNH